GGGARRARRRRARGALAHAERRGVGAARGRLRAAAAPAGADGRELRPRRSRARGGADLRAPAAPRRHRQAAPAAGHAEPRPQLRRNGRGERAAPRGAGRSPGMKVGLVGCGLVGGSLGLALRARGAVVVGQDRDPRTAERALALGVVDEVGPVEAAEVVVLAVPVRSIPASARSLATFAGVVTDVGSTKATVVRGCETVFGGRFVGGRPIAGSERSRP